MHPDIERLLIVQEIDVEVRRLREDLARYPDWRKTRVAAIERERQRLADGEGRLVELEKRIRASDLALREAREAGG
jgi:predicted  nucleic acid-binding Zn-ribbon protein